MLPLFVKFWRFWHQNINHIKILILGDLGLGAYGGLPFGASTGLGLGCMFLIRCI